jgi:hypothetical protein
MVPKECYDTAMEIYLEEDAEKTHVTSSALIVATGSFNKNQLVSLLLGQLFNSSSPGYEKLKKFITKHKLS